MDQQTRNSAIAAAMILIGFGVVAYFLPKIMIAVGNWSTVAAGAIAIAFVAAFVLLFWWRGKSRGG